MKNIIWLASYPKSGNTWLRAFLYVLINNKKLDINEIDVGGFFSDKGIIENILDIEPDTINQHLLDAYRRLTFQHLSDTVQTYNYVKIHDAYTLSAFDNLPIVPEAPSKMAIYIVRNPLDVVLSYAHHLRASVNSTIDRLINNPTAIISGTNFRNDIQFPQILGSWTVHVKSWLEQQEIPVYLLKYEDILAQPFATFKKMVEAIGLIATDLQLQKAIDATAFDNLKQMEQDQGFRERYHSNTVFFNKGISDRWKTELTAEQIDKIVAVNGEMMQKLGYL
jgi:hypothetical protein